MKEDSTVIKIKGKYDELIDFMTISLPNKLGEKERPKQIEREVDSSILSIAYFVNDKKEITCIEISGLMQLLEEGEE